MHLIVAPGGEAVKIARDRTPTTLQFAGPPRENRGPDGCEARGPEGYCGMMTKRGCAGLVVVACLAGRAAAGVGDPQVKTDHAWYPGELACSTFERLAATQAEVYRGVTGVRPRTDEEKALASW